MHYYLVLLLQGFCLYHCYRNRNETYWYFVIFFIPIVGCLIYLFTQVYNKRDAEKVTNEIATFINPSKKVNDLTKQIEFSDTFQNRVNLADAYNEINDYQNAIKHYEIALKDDHENDFYVIRNLIHCHYYSKRYKQVVFYSEKVIDHVEFKKSRSQFLYGLALEELGKSDEAEKQIRVIDQRYSNYDERLVLAQFLIDKNKHEDAEVILNEIISESEHMTKPNKRKYRATISEAKKLLNT